MQIKNKRKPDWNVWQHTKRQTRDVRSRCNDTTIIHSAWMQSWISKTSLIDANLRCPSVDAFTLQWHNNYSFSVNTVLGFKDFSHWSKHALPLCWCFHAAMIQQLFIQRECSLGFQRLLSLTHTCAAPLLMRSRCNDNNYSFSVNAALVFNDFSHWRKPALPLCWCVHAAMIQQLFIQHECSLGFQRLLSLTHTCAAPLLMRSRCNDNNYSFSVNAALVFNDFSHWRKPALPLCWCVHAAMIQQLFIHLFIQRERSLGF